jgi:hypothetical protein
VSQATCRGGSFAVESVAAFAWNGWQASSGISGNLGLEYAVLPWDHRAVDATVEAMRLLMKVGTPIGSNDTAIAGHAIASGCTLVTNNVRGFSRVTGLIYEDWVESSFDSAH